MTISATPMLTMTMTPVAEGRSGLSARARILGWMMVLAAVAIGLVVLVTARILEAELDADARRELTHEASKFRSFADRGDPGTGQPFGDVPTLLSSYLLHSLPNTNEAFFSVVDGAAGERTAGRPPARLDRDQAFVTRAASAREPIWGTTGAGRTEAYYAVFPVRTSGPGVRGALSVIEFQHAARSQMNDTVRVLGLVGFGSWLFAGVIGWVIAGRVLAPIRALRQTAAKIGESDLSRRIEVTGSGDVAEMAATFNGMLNRVESAFVSQRAFLDDAGHELRTPITIIRGHLELVDDDPDEAARTRALVLGELDRMARIVDDLMVLAKAERPDFLVTAPVDLAEFIVETLAKVQAIAPRRWKVDEVAEATALGDGQRLTQALTQLVANALRHTDVDDTIALGSKVHGGRVLLWVADTGSGIAPEEQATIFERFSQGSRTLRGDGLGLGLSIVAAIAGAHGGRVTLRSEPGEGSTFTLDLPYRPVDSQPEASP